MLPSRAERRSPSPPQPINDDLKPLDEAFREPRFYLPQVIKKEKWKIINDQSGKIVNKKISGKLEKRKKNLKPEWNVITFTPSEMKKQPKIVTEERKEEAVIEEKNKEMQKEPNTMDEKAEMIAEKRKTEALKGIIEKPSILKEKSMVAEEERKESRVVEEMKEEQRKRAMATGERIAEEAAAPQNEVKKEELAVKEKLKSFKENNEAIQNDRLKGIDKEKKEDSATKEETFEDSMIGKPRYFPETEVHEKKPKEKVSRKRRWLWKEEDKGLLDWLDSAFIDDVLKKVCKNKKFIALALVAFSTGFYVSRKLRTRGR